MLFCRKILVVFVVFMPFLLNAQVVKKIEVDGLSRFSKSTVLVYSSVSIGDDLNDSDIKSIINNLFVTDFFDDIKVQLSDEGVLKITVIEKPVISNVKITGHSHLKEDRIESILIEQGISVGRTFNQRKVELCKRQLLSIYTHDGYYSAKVDIAGSKTEQGRVELNVQIEEGPVATIAKIVFHGNDSILDYNLKKSMNSKVTDLTSFIFGTNKYSEYGIEQDIIKIQMYYADRGYPNAKVKNYKASLNESKSGIIIDLFIDEGDYQSIDGFKISGLDNYDIYDTFDAKLPMPYSRSVLLSIERQIRRTLHDRGFFLQKIERKFEFSDEKNIVHFNIVKGKPVYIDSINITGNNNTREDIIRNHITLPDGALFSASSINDIEDSLYITGYFDRVDISVVPLTDDSVVINIDLEERATKSITGGIELSNVSLGVSAEVEDNNFFGTGYSVSTSFEWDKYTKDLKLSITNPYAFDNRLSLTYSIDKRKHKYQNSHMLSQNLIDTIDHTLGTGFKITSKTRYYAYLKYATEVLPEKSAELQQISLSGTKSGESIESYGFGQVVSTNTYNFYRFPTRGYKTSISFYANTPLSDFTFFDVAASASRIFPIKNGFLWYSSFSGRYLIPYGQEDKAYIPSSRYLRFSGAHDVRGYAYSSIGPVSDSKTVEGNLKVTFRNELVVPNSYLHIDTDSVRMSVFLDAGQIYRTYRKSGVQQPRGFCYSAGIAMRLSSALLPISLSLNFPLNKHQNIGVADIERYSFGTLEDF